MARVWGSTAAAAGGVERARDIECIDAGEDGERASGSFFSAGSWMQRFVRLPK